MFVELCHHEANYKRGSHSVLHLQNFLLASSPCSFSSLSLTSIHSIILFMAFFFPLGFFFLTLLPEKCLLQRVHRAIFPSASAVSRVNRVSQVVISHSLNQDPRKNCHSLNHPYQQFCTGKQCLLHSQRITVIKNK